MAFFLFNNQWFLSYFKVHGYCDGRLFLKLQIISIFCKFICLLGTICSSNTMFEYTS